ncbi:hypothetical protein VCHC78A1_03346A, partial [Vibrio cholerae HC-78A1]
MSQFKFKKLEVWPMISVGYYW